MKNFHALALVLLAVGLSACDQEVKITNGQIPQELVSQVAPLMGTYSGQMERQANALTFQLDGNRVVATSEHDLIGSGCQTKIGNLLSISYSEDKEHHVQITEAHFDLDPNNCAREVRGRELHIYFSSKHPGSFSVEILDHTDYYQACSIYANPPYGTHEECHLEPRNIYLEGDFHKAN